MILIDVFIPPIDKIYDFEIDESISASTLIDNIIGLIEVKEKVSFSKEKRELFLYRTGEFIKDNISLNKQNIVNGDRMILI